jgi:hypothetical protein
MRVRAHVCTRVRAILECCLAEDRCRQPPRRAVGRADGAECGGRGDDFHRSEKGVRVPQNMQI